MVRRQKIHYAEQGFSLLEMMASVIIMSIVVGGIFSLVTRNQMFGKNESESSEVVQNARAALQVADYGYVLETGELVLEGPARDLAENPRVIETYLGLARSASNTRK